MLSNTHVSATKLVQGSDPSSNPQLLCPKLQTMTSPISSHLCFPLRQSLLLLLGPAHLLKASKSITHLSVIHFWSVKTRGMPSVGQIEAHTACGDPESKSKQIKKIEEVFGGKRRKDVDRGHTQ